MKRILSLLLSLLLIAGLLAGCTGSAGNEPAETDVPISSDTDTDHDHDHDHGGVYDGRIGQTIETYFFDFKVNSAYLCEEYYGFVPQEGNVLLVVNVDVENTMNSTIPMSDLDFQAQWTDTASDAFAWPITSDPETMEERGPFGEEQLPYEYELGIGESRNGDLVYEVPAGEKDFSISTMDDFADSEEEGDVYFVYFTAGYM